MKVLIILALAVAVANAAFTGSLVQQTKPLLDKARMNMQVAVTRNVRARNSAEAGFQTTLIQGLHDQAAALLGQIESAVAAGQQVAEYLLEQYNSTLEQLTSLGGNIVDAASGILSGLLDNLGNLWSSIFCRKLRRSSIEITPAMASIIQMVVTNPTFVNLFRSEPMYQCLKANGITVDYAHMQGLNQAGQLSIELLNKPEVAQCLAEVGGIASVIQTSPTVSFVHQLAGQLGLKPMIVALMNQHLGPELTSQIVALLNSRHRGFFDGLSNLWGAISEGASNAWESISNGISNGVSNFADFVANVVSNIYDSAVDQFTQVQSIASIFLQNALANATQLGLQGAQALINFLAPYQADLGVMWTQISTQLNDLYGQVGLIIPGIN